LAAIRGPPRMPHGADSGKGAEPVLPRALGFALPFGKDGIHVTIFNERVERFSKIALATVPKLLGNAMAHEIGHVLLESCEHSSVTCRWTGYARDGMAGGPGTRNDRSHRKCAGADGSGGHGCSGRCTFEADASSPVDYVRAFLSLLTTGWPWSFGSPNGRLGPPPS
jgi:hypothetical protein